MSICRNDKNHLGCFVRFRKVFLHIFYLVDCLPHRIQQCCASPDIIIFIRKRLHNRDREPVVNNVYLVVKENRCYIDVIAFFFLLLQHSIEATDGVILKAAHGTASIQNKNQLSHISIHNEYLLTRS